MDLEEIEIRLRGRARDEGPWKLAASKLAGRGIFASRHITQGETVFIDTPLLIGPRARGETVCASCLRVGLKLEGCHCGLPLCGAADCGAAHRDECERLRAMAAGRPRAPGPWSPNLLAALTPLRALYTLDGEQLATLGLMQAHSGPQHEREVGLAKQELTLSPAEETLMSQMCRVIDAVAFEVVTDDGGTGRAIYPLAGMLNHSCSPNTKHAFTALIGERGERTYGMMIMTTRDVKSGEEVTTNYCPLLWGTQARVHYLSHTKHFICTCARCTDPTEFGTYFSSIECNKCGGRLVAGDPGAVGGGRWRCSRSCGAELGPREAAVRLAREALLPPSTLQPAFLQQFSLQQTLKSVWKMDKNPGILQEITDEELLKHEKIIRSVLDLMKQLRLGMCTMRGHLLYQLYVTIKEKQRRMMINSTELLGRSPGLNKSHFQRLNFAASSGGMKPWRILNKKLTC